MNFYAGTLGQLVIVELFVLYIWFNVLIDTMREKNITSKELHTSYNKLLLTAVGLVLNSIAITGIMAFRAYELIGDDPFSWVLVPLYVVLAIGNFFFILSASIGSNMRLFKLFILTTMIWTAVVFLYSGFS